MLQMYSPDWRRNILDKYTVKLNPKAIQDLDKIYKYTALDKFAPENAGGQMLRIKKAILSLELFPQKHQDRIEGRYADKGYKQLLTDNYITIFKIDEIEKTVFVITVQYQGRNL